MARFAKTKSKTYSTTWLLAKCGTGTEGKQYRQMGEGAGYPAGGLVLTAGIDTQDNGFYYVVRAWGENMETWLASCDFIECDMKDEKYKNKDEILALVSAHLITNLPARLNDTRLGISCAFMDRGGHRHKDVDYLAAHLPWLHAYTGTVNHRAPLIERSKNANYFMGHTENLSKTVEGYSESELWHLPEDITEDYCTQFLKQYWEEKIDRHGNRKTEWMHGGKDHYRDCENLNAAAMLYLQLEQRMFDPSEVGKIKEIPTYKTAPRAQSDDIEGAPRSRAIHAKGSYMDRYGNY
jgi:hypothetical protein